MEDSSSSPAPRQLRWRRKRNAVVAVAAATPVAVHIVRSTRPLSPAAFLDLSSGPIAMLSLPFPPSSSERSGSRRAEEIVRRSYARTFGALLSIEVSCGPGIDGKSCLESLLLEATEEVANATHSVSFPWWFVTMLRDANGAGNVHGGWHKLSFFDPPLDFCSIEKVATTQWRNVQCFLNMGMEPTRTPRPCHLNATSLRARRKIEKGVARVVMLRDPLERLLSGYLNKCAETRRRNVEGHCQPNEVFNGSDMTLRIRKDPKQLFAAYVDAFPLKWNLHFFPQSIYCDGLFSQIDDYDFVGRMDDQFYVGLMNMSEKFGEGNSLPLALEKVFHLSDELGKRESVNVGKETKAPSHVREYFTAASVSRALEYFAVDYMKLGMEVPSWAHDILSEEEEAFKN